MRLPIAPLLVVPRRVRAGDLVADHLQPAFEHLLLADEVLGPLEVGPDRLRGLLGGRALRGDLVDERLRLLLEVLDLRLERALRAEQGLQALEHGRELRHRRTNLVAMPLSLSLA